jgi:predicted transcriptional regulator
MKYKVIEKRISVIEYEIEAESEDVAKRLEGEIINEQETDNYGYELVSCEEIES